MSELRINLETQSNFINPPRSVPGWEVEDFVNVPTKHVVIPQFGSRDTDGFFRADNTCDIRESMSNYHRAKHEFVLAEQQYLASYKTEMPNSEYSTKQKVGLIIFAGIMLTGAVVTVTQMDSTYNAPEPNIAPVVEYGPLPTNIQPPAAEQ